MATTTASPKPTEAPPPASSRSSTPVIEYSFMFEKDKSPTQQLDALLRAIGRYIVQEIGDKTVTHLTPEKLAAFYHAVGGDYDSLFVEIPHESISYAWQVTGCQHSLQPTDDDFAPPTIPALTPRGFSRWESLEILLGPEEHVPFLQFAVRNWHLKHPETGQEFPPELPKTVFPTEADVDVDRWHKSCVDRLKDEASPNKAREMPKPGPPPEQAEPKFAYTHVRPPSHSTPRPRGPETGYFERPVSYNHVPGAGRPPRSRHSPDKYRQETLSDDHARRRSFSDYTMPPKADTPPYAPGQPYLDPHLKGAGPMPRRHSQPRHYSSDSSDDVPPRMKRRPESPPFRRVVPPGQPGPGVGGASIYRHRPDFRPDEPRRRQAASPSLREKITEKVSNILPNGKGSERPRHSRQNSYSNEPRPRRSREQMPPSRLSRSFSDLDSDDSSEGESNEDLRRRRRMREERERDRERERFRERERGRPRDDDDRRERQYMRRPDMERRTSSHADADRRQHGSWDPRDRKRWERRMSEDRGASPVTGVSGRRYPEPAYS